MQGLVRGLTVASFQRHAGTSSLSGGNPTAHWLDSMLCALHEAARALFATVLPWHDSGPQAARSYVPWVVVRALGLALGG